MKIQIQASNSRLSIIPLLSNPRYVLPYLQCMTMQSFHKITLFLDCYLNFAYVNFIFVYHVYTIIRPGCWTQGAVSSFQPSNFLMDCANYTLRVTQQYYDAQLMT